MGAIYAYHSNDKIGDVRLAPVIQRSALFCNTSNVLMLLSFYSPNITQPYSILLRMKAIYTLLIVLAFALHLVEDNALSTLMHFSIFALIYLI